MGRDKNRFVFIRPEPKAKVSGEKPIVALAAATTPEPLPSKPQTPGREERGGSWEGKDTLSLIMAVCFGGVPMPIGHDQVVASARMLLVTGAILYPSRHFPWVRKIQAVWKRNLMLFGTSAAIVSLTFLYTWIIWPHDKRHTLSSKEKEVFEQPLKTAQGPVKSVEFSCSQNDEKTCVFARGLLPLFIDAGWDVDGVVQPVVQPMVGIVIVQHTDSNPDPHNAKLGVWEPITNSLLDIRQAFNNIKIEPSSTASIAIPKDKIMIYIGSEREDETAPTDLTQTVKDMAARKKSGQLKPNEYPEIK